MMSAIRPPAVAGYFYPAEADELTSEVRRYLREAVSAARDHPPKAIIVPHAGYMYSAKVAAAAYAPIMAAGGSIRRVVLLGPGHRMAVPGIAVPDATAFRTPIGNIPVDQAAIQDILGLPQVELRDDAHRDEHSLEVQLPFLQAVLPAFQLVPLVVGGATPEQVSEVLERLWGGPETLIVLSSDLSHYKDYGTAQALDGQTATAIEALDATAIGREQACGRLLIAGFLSLAKRHGLTAERLDLCNSGDTGGPKDRVVGYGSWAFWPSTAESGEPEAPKAPDTVERRADWNIFKPHAKALLRAAATGIRYALQNGKQPHTDLLTAPEPLRTKAASFVTLHRNNRLRGCIGTVEATRPILLDVVDNAYRAAFKDPRFTPLQPDELRGISLSISVLSTPVEINYTDETDLLGQIRRHSDGLIIRNEMNRGVFLPQVWKDLENPTDFLARLKGKAGIEGPLDPNRDRTHSFSANSIGTVVLDAWRPRANREPGN
jgi:AmmeMemoRadiSam system protein B/AmmeMemoRadiSam system protein A